MEKYHKIFTGSAILVNRLAFLLREANVSPIIKDEKESARLAGFGTTGDAVELFILQTDFEDSKKIIENFLKEIEK